LEKEEKELLKEEELEKLFLKNISSEIMDEVMLVEQIGRRKRGCWTN
jgi:hypothetical protein